MDDNMKGNAELFRKMAMAVDAMQQKTARFEQWQEQTVQALQQTLAGVRQDVDRLMQAAEQRTAQTVRQTMESALDPLAQRSGQAVGALSAQLAQAGQGMDQAIQSSMARLHRHVRNSYLAVAGAMALVILGGGLLLWHQHQSYTDAEMRTEAANVNADTAELYARVGMSSCGGQACLKLDMKSPHWGSHGEYVLLEPAAKH